MIYTTTTKDKKTEVNGHTREGGWHPVMVAPPVALCRESALSCRLLGTPYPPCEQLLAAVVGGAVVVVDPRWSLPVITCTHQPSSLRAVARSGGVWCHGCHRLPLVPVVILSCVGGAGAGAGAGAVGVGVGVIVVVVSSPPSPPPSCSSSSWRW
jgi:hypothetical protein